MEYILHSLNYVINNLFLNDSFDQFSTFFIANVAKLLEAKQASEKLQTPNATLIVENEAVLKALYLRVSEGNEGRIAYGAMCTLLQTVLPLDSCCYRLMIALVCSVDKLVIIDDAIKLQGRILMVD